ncbi:arsenate reductase [Cyanobium sp. PCC 7001]|uniref:arsenate reductase family protein n=1 Tax=Cyanobium sp. PCC 7001 TaxID=180281 RepID=UPI0001805172|nr:arsenate reductase family protein [Cyanobium sp. PCC 7001]EDY39620.1 arsenate reductase [Cyanobium sp. PCC 7001]
MAGLTVYSYAKCSTCRKALAWLAERGLDPTVIDITHHPPSRAELEQALGQLGRQRLFNTSGQSYRSLGAAAEKAMDDQQALEALAADGKLIKRPFLIRGDGRTLTGFRPEEWEALLPG